MATSASTSGSDYRNAPFRFINAGLNLVQVPEALADGEYTRLLNVHVTTEGVLEGRPGTNEWWPEIPREIGAPKGPDALYGTYEHPYPDHWNIGEPLMCEFIGFVKHYDDQLIPAYVTQHEMGAVDTTTGNANEYGAFINGAPILDASDTPCPDATTVTSLGALTITSKNVVRATAPSGTSIVILDGRTWIGLDEIDLYNMEEEYASYDYGDETADVPLFVAHKLGITAPADPIDSVTKTNTGSGGLNTTVTGASGYVWRYTYFNPETKFESPPSTIEDVDPTTHTSSFDAVITVDYSGDEQVKEIRLWRTGGVLVDEYRLVATVDNVHCGDTTTITDDTADLDMLLNELLDTESIEPFTTVDDNGDTIEQAKFPTCFGPFLGKYYFWVGDAFRPHYIYWSNESDVGLWDPSFGSNSLSNHGEELLNGFIFGGLPYVWSRLHLYALDYGGPEALPEFVPREIPIGMGCAGRYAFALGPGAVYYVSHDGIYSTMCQGDRPVSLTDNTLKPIFRGEEAGDLEPVDFDQPESLLLELVGNDLHFIYIGATTGAYYHLVADTTQGRWCQWTPDTYRWVSFDEGGNRKRMYLGTDAVTLFEWDEAFPASTEEFTCQARTGSWSGGVPLTDKQFGVFMIDLDPGFGSGLLNFYFNSEAETNSDIGEVDTNTYNFSGRLQRSVDLQSTFARSFAVDITWEEKPTVHPKFYQGNLLFRVDEEEIVHWSSDWISLDIEGWNHIKDSWWCIRSDGEVRLTVSGERQDGEIQSFTYDLPDTSGVKKRFYVEHPPILAKMWKFELDGRQELGDDFPPTFKFYGEDSILNVKQWKTGGSYKQVSPFTAPGYASYLRSEGGT